MIKNIKAVLFKIYNGSDMFKCSSCGYATYIRVLGDSCRCPKCGGTMRRL